MGNRIKASLTFGAASLLLGCSGNSEGSPESVPIEVSTPAPEAIEPSTSIESKQASIEQKLTEVGFTKVDDGRLGNVWFGFEQGADRDLATIQYRVGSYANQLLVGIKDFPVVIDGKQYSANFSVPNPNTVRAYVISPTSPASHTNQTLVPTSDGQFNLEFARGIIGQENVKAGFIVNATVELCQGLDMDVATPDAAPVTSDLYTTVKEGVCNSLGYATDRAFLGIPYVDYAKEFTGETISSPDANHGAVINYTLLDSATYAMFLRSGA